MKSYTHTEKYAPTAPGYWWLRLQHGGYLGEHNRPLFPASSYVFQSLCGIVHFHYCNN
jgi:hypothetical protein